MAENGAKWLMLASGKSNVPGGCVVAFTYPNGTGWVGFFLMQKTIRGMGFGRKLWKALEANYKASGTTIVGLDGVQQQVQTYERRGYKDCARIHLMVRPSIIEKPIEASTEPSNQSDNDLVQIATVDPKLLAQSDLEHTGLDRSELWNSGALLHRSDVKGYALVPTESKAKSLLGFIVVRRCEEGHRFGPLYAETYDQAVFLLATAMNSISDPKGSMIAEIFGSNPNGRKVFEELGWTWSGTDYHRMWLGGRLPKEQQESGKGTKGMFAIFDAAEG